jgi:hypothetical protein
MISLSPTMYTERALDPATDLPAMAELICEVNAFDDVDWYPTAANLASEWAAAPTFDPRRDTRLVIDGDRIVAATRQAWRERAGRVVHRIEIWVHPDVRGRHAESERRARAVRALRVPAAPDLGLLPKAFLTGSGGL